MRRICILLIFVFCVLILIGCASVKREKSEVKTPVIPKLIESNPSQRPDWADSIPQSEETLYFVGLSNGIATEKEARDDAYQNVLSQVVKYYGELIKTQANETKTVKALSSDIIDPYIESEEQIQRYAEAYVHEILMENYYTEHWLVGENDEWRCWVKCSVSKSKIQQEIENFAADVSERYCSLLPEKQNVKYYSTKSAVQAYLDVYQSIHNNPVYQAVAYIETSAGKASLDEYSLQQAKRILQNIHIEKIDYTTRIEPGTDFKATIHLASPDYERITEIEAVITLFRGGRKIISGVFETNDKNDIEVSINSDKLEFGDYSVSIKLYTDIYKELGGVYTSSSNITFTFDYLKAPVKIEYMKENTVAKLSDLGNEITTTVKNILQEKIKENDIPINIVDSDSLDAQFVVQIKSTELKAAEGVQKIRLTATLLFKRDGITIVKSSDFTADGLSKKNMATENAFAEVCELISEENIFFENIRKIVGVKR